MSLLRAREAVMRRFRPVLRAHEITEQQWRVLRALTALDQAEITELARATFLLGPSLSRILQDLATRHLIELRTAEMDHRRTIVALAPEGLSLIEAIAPLSEAIYAEISRRFGVSRLSDLQEMLLSLESSLAATTSMRASASD